MEKETKYGKFNKTKKGKGCMGYMGKKIYRGGKNGDKEEGKKKGRGRTKGIQQ
jgi:hypothetical protein